MDNWRVRVLNGTALTNCSTLVVLLPVFVSLLSSAQVIRSQARSTNYPGPAIREGNRAMDDYDRTINRMKNDAKAANQRRLNLFPEINEDFQRVQVLHNEIVRMLQSDKALNYDHLADLTGDVKKRCVRLRTNLALPEAEKTEAHPGHSEAIDDPHLRKSIVELHDLVVSFVANPMFKNLGVVDAKVIVAARENLDGIIKLSEKIRREAELLSKARK